MKRFGHLIEKIADIENLKLADAHARRGKGYTDEIKEHDKHKEEDLKKLQQRLLEGTYQTSKYSTFKVYEPKERLIFKLPYFPDRVCHHAILNILEPIWVNTFISQTYACIKKRGIHKLLDDLRNDLKDREGTLYCLKLDVHKFYPSIDHAILKGLIRKKIKDKILLKVLDNIIDSSEGVPIGNYLSQFLGNLYLSPLDHYLKEVVKVHYYKRYCDDMILLSDSKEELQDWFHKIQEFLAEHLHLQLKPNYQIFLTDSRGIDFVGYKFYHSHILLRKSIKERIKKLIRNRTKILRSKFLSSIGSYYGWLTHANCKHLAERIQSYTGLHLSIWKGKKVGISHIYNQPIYAYGMSRFGGRFTLQFVGEHQSYAAVSKDRKLLTCILRNLGNNQHYIKYERHKKNRVRRKA